MAISPDGRYVAGSRANRVEVYELSTRRIVARLVDGTGREAAHRDVVNALAFSPDGEWIASAGFREVKLWRRSVAGARDAEGTVVSGPWTAVDEMNTRGVRLAGTRDGVVTVRDAMGHPVRTLHLGRGAVRSVRATPEGRRVAAVIEGEGVVVVDVETGVALRASPGVVLAETLHWMDAGREVAVGTEGGSRLKRWRVPEEWSAAGTLEALGDLDRLEAALVSAGQAGPKRDHRYLVGADGSVKLFAPGVESPVRELPTGPPSVAGAVSLDLQHVALAGADGVVRVWNWEGTPKLISEGGPDAGLSLAVTRAEQAETFLRREVEFHQAAVQRGEEEVRKTGETLAKATTRQAENEKALAAKRAELKTQADAQAAAQKEKDELAAAWKQASEAWSAAEATMKEARNQAASVSSAADQVPQRLDALVTAAMAAGQAKAALDRATAEIPPRQKQAEEKLAAATKAIADLDGPLKKAEIAVSTSVDDATLARSQSERATRELAESKSARERNEAARPAAAAALEAAKAEATRHISSLVTRLTFAPDGTTLAAARASGRIQVWDVATGGLRDSWTCEAVAGVTAGTGAILGLEWSGDSLIRVMTERAEVRHGVVNEWSLARTLGGEGTSAAAGFQDRVNALAFRGDGGALLTGGGEPTRGGEMKLWSIPDGKLLRDFGTLHSDAVLALAFSPDGGMALSGGADRFMRLVDLGTGKAVRHFEGHTHHVMGVAWLRDARTVASAGAEAAVKVWNCRTGDRLKNVDGFGKEVVSIQPLGVSDQFVAATGAGQARVFKAGGETVRSLDARGAFLHALAVTPEGRWAVGGDAEGTLRVWSVEDGKLVAELSAGR
ncbi:MAG: hypothetical protein IT580_10715 [Verrucomicrobiales bacterium]|nr:hypothetical protein [Verrucomicrobiales bacterium]